MKIKLFTHTDLDGVGAVIVANHVFGSKFVNYDLCNYGEVNEKVEKFLLSPDLEKYDHVFITDISVNEHVADLLEAIHQTDKGMVQLIDHHSTAEWLNKYEWAKVHEEEKSFEPRGTRKTSGTSLFYEWLTEEGFYDGWMMLEDFCELVRRYDSWEWSTIYNDQHAKQLNDLLYIIGKSKFINRFTENLDPRFTEAEQLLLDSEQENINKYIDSKDAELQQIIVDGNTVGVVFGDQYISQLGNELSKRHVELDLIIIVNIAKGLLSYRTIHDHVDVAQIAKKFGGGGHPKASGSPFPTEHRETFLKNIFGA